MENFKRCTILKEMPTHATDGTAVNCPIEPFVSCDFDTWAFNQCVKLGNKIEGIKDATGKNIAWINTTTKEQYFLYGKSN